MKIKTLDHASINFTRKPVSFDEVETLEGVEIPMSLIADLPTYETKDLFTFENENEQFYLIKNNSDLYLVDSQGFNYPRYVVKLNS
jgi:hypothetical protein